MPLPHFPGVSRPTRSPLYENKYTIKFYNNNGVLLEGVDSHEVNLSEGVESREIIFSMYSTPDMIINFDNLINVTYCHICHCDKADEIVSSTIYEITIENVKTSYGYDKYDFIVSKCIFKVKKAHTSKDGGELKFDSVIRDFKIDKLFD